MSGRKPGKAARPSPWESVLAPGTQKKNEKGRDPSPAWSQTAYCTHPIPQPINSTNMGVFHTEKCHPKGGRPWLVKTYFLTGKMKESSGYTARLHDQITLLDPPTVTSSQKTSF